VNARSRATGTVGDGRGGLVYTESIADGCHIHHCDFHDCLVEGLGYGVSVGGGYHEIDHNTFDRCRHAITASGAETTGYDAHHTRSAPSSRRTRSETASG
jgi:hypothetical protein